MNGDSHSPRVANTGAAQVPANREPAPAPAWGTGRLLAVLVGYKLCFALGVMVCMLCWPDEGQFAGHRHWPLQGEYSPMGGLAAWDGAHYLFLAQNGYVKGDLACAFYPLWPALIRAGAWLTGGNLFLAGLLLANALSLAAWWHFYCLVAEHHGPRVAARALLLLLAFPGAIFFQFIYTESLFLLLLVLFFRCLPRGNYRGAALVGFFLPLTKAVGFLCLLPFAWELLVRRRPWREFGWLLGPILGYASYFVVFWSTTGNPFEGMQAQRFYPNQPSIANVFNVTGILKAFLNVHSFHGSMDSALDRFFFVVFLASLPLVWRLSRTYFWYALCAGSIPALSTWFFSYSRNVITCFPIFIALGALGAERKERWMLYYYAALLSTVQGFFLVRYVSFKWAG